jgi:threonine dehydratase
MQFTAEELAWAAGIVGRHVPPTPQYVWPLLAGNVGAEVWVKHENHTPTGAFKVRGGLVYAERLRTGRPGVKGIVSATRGNHGQSLAFAGRASGIDVTIVVPDGNSPDKNAAMIGFGAELIVFGHDFQAAREHASVLGAQRGLETVPSYHPDLVLGVATYARELFDAAGELDAVYVPVGMGSGICGVIGVRDLLGLRTEVIGVVAEQAPATARSVAAGRVVTTDTANTFIDGVACRVPDADAISVICPRPDHQRRRHGRGHAGPVHGHPQRARARGRTRAGRAAGRAARGRRQTRGRDPDRRERGHRPAPPGPRGPHPRALRTRHTAGCYASFAREPDVPPTPGGPS